LVFDNYDSFTYNLVQIIEQILGEKVDVLEMTKFLWKTSINTIKSSFLPGIPEEAGILLEVIKKYAPTKSIFGVCLGQQAIAEAFGGSLINLSEIYHGVATEAKQVKPHKILENLPEVLEVGVIILGR
jgi:anthranilate synthase component 2